MSWGIDRWGVGSDSRLECSVVLEAYIPIAI